MKHVILIALLLSLLSAAPAWAAPVAQRQPKYPLKTARTLHSDEAIARARQSVKNYPSAKKLADDIIKRADKWLAWTDADLRFLITSSDVPRAFAVNAAGCPQCGGKIIEKSGGDYGWIIDPKLPFKVKCPVDGSVYPTNDYETYYRSGFTEKRGWDTAHVDDGWGAPADAQKPAGEKFWFVAYYNHWMWHRHLVPAMHALANAYTLTGDARYAHKAAIMLHRVAEVYPGMDHAKQSRYGAMMAERGVAYDGKVVNHIWEPSLAQSIAEAYDAVWQTIDGDAELQRQTGKTGPEVRAFIEANALEDAIDAYFSGKIRGNFGMHQAALVRLAQVRQHGETSRWFDLLLNENSSTYPSLGLNYALYNLISRDGVPVESAPGYNSIWVRKIAAYGDELHAAGRDVFGSLRAKRMFDAVLDQVHAGGRFTASIGDSGNVYGALVGADPQTFATAYRHYKDPRFAAFLAKMNATGANSFKSWESLFHPPIDAATDAATMPPAKPRLLDGYGLAVLNNPSDTISLALYYGQKHGHGHFDRLNFELFAHGQPILPDLGYPDAMNDFVPGIYTWSKNTIAHNTVVVDGRRQVGEAPGEVKLFANGDGVRAVDIEAKETYPQSLSYRRAMIMIDCGEDQSYFVDIFTVIAGRQQDYSLHGPPGEFEMIGGEWSGPAKGTLAGENVALGDIYDDANLVAARGGFSAYTGSGFQHLCNVRTQQKPGWVAQWKHEKDPKSQVRIRVLDQPGQTMMLCDARVSPVKSPKILKYLIARRSGLDKPPTRFISVIEPFNDQPFITGVRHLALAQGDGVALEVKRADGFEDVIVYAPDGSARLQDRRITTSAVIAVNTYHRASRPIRWFRANVLEAGAAGGAGVNQPMTGRVKAVYPFMSAVSVKLDQQHLLYDARARAALEGRVIHFRNDRHRTAHTVLSVAPPDADGAQGDLLLTLADDVLLGLAKVDAVQAGAVTTATALPLAPAYRGVTLADDMFRFQHAVRNVADGKITFAAPLPDGHPLKPGGNVWLMDVGVGDVIEIPSVRWNP